ncbi:site-specific integrase [Synechococcus sp. UW179B]|uniref:site-specific integrase n=1 Tax=Synechococcus sp. UW179B TaxID=2575516 RepID=UPI001A7E17EE|nr:site-specific integrase [Synechococcus sp. UW179B]
MKQGLVQVPRTSTKSGNWDHDLRRQIKREHGIGWKVQGQGKATRLFKTMEDGSRPSVTLEIEWAPSSATAIANAVGVLKSRMDEHDISLREAHRRSQQVAGVVTGQGVVAGAIDWKAAADAFLIARNDRRATTLRDTTNRINNALQILNGKPRPTDGASLMQAYASTFFDHCPAGGVGRKRHLGDVAAFLDYAIEKCGAPGRWKPLEGEDRDALVGTADDGDDKLTPPVKPEQLEALLDALIADEKPELWLAVALVGCFGLRPAELAALSVDDGRLKVASNVKRNRRSMKNQKPPRLAIALELDGRDDGARALRQFESGLVKLPRAIRTAIDSGEFKKVGDAFRQLLDRYPFWQSLVSSTPDLTPYSLRHGWAWRAHKGYAMPLSVRDAASLLGHTPSTHHLHYGRWTDEAGLLEAVERITGTTAPSKAQAKN